MKIDQKYQILVNAHNPQHGDDALAMETCFNLLSLSRLIDDACARRLQPYGLSEGKFIVLFLLHEKGDLSPYQIADLAKVTRATMTGLLDGLEKQKLVKRKAMPSDRRRLVVTLTQEGARLAEQLLQTHSAWIVSLMQGVSSEDAALMNGFLYRISMNINEMDGRHEDQ